MRHQRITLADYLQANLSRGQVSFDRGEAIAELDIAKGAFLDAAERLQRQGQLVRLRQSFYVIVPPQYRSWGAPPPTWYIDALMRFLGRPYYVGLLKAAELHGAAQQAVMEFQVVTTRQLRPIQAGRSQVVFYFRKALDGIQTDLQPYKTDAGAMKLSSPELTAWDLFRYPRGSGGIDRIATVLSELGAKLQPGRLAALAPAFDGAALQRLGHVLDRLGHHAPAYALSPILAASKPLWVELDPADAGDPDFAPAPIERDQRWRVIVRRPLDVDQ